MNTVEVNKLLNNGLSKYQNIFDTNEDVYVDFTDIESIDLKGINLLLNLKKIAILNKKNLKINNASPAISQLLDITGIFNPIEHTMTNPILSKREIK